MESCLQVAEETIANDEVVVIKGSQEGHAVSVLLRGANDYMLDEMDRSLHDSFCVIKRVLESGTVVPGINPPPPISHLTHPPNSNPHPLSLVPTPLKLREITQRLHCGLPGSHYALDLRKNLGENRATKDPKLCLKTQLPGVQASKEVPITQLQKAYSEGFRTQVGVPWKQPCQSSWKILLPL